MVPREHGAYAELLFPMVTVFLGGSPTTSTWLLAAGAVGAFLANEPILVLVGQRGNRVKREEGSRAKRMLLAFALTAMAAGVAGLVNAPRPAQYAVAIPFGLGLAVVLLAVRGRERSMAGETLAAAALSSTAIPLGLTAGWSPTVALSVALIWLATALLATSVVRLTIARAKAKTEEEMRLVLLKRATLIAVCVVVIGFAGTALTGERTWALIFAAALPMAATVLAIAVLQPTARRLRLLGWSLVGANTLTLIAVVTALRIIQDFDAVEPTLPFPMF